MNKESVIKEIETATKNQGCNGFVLVSFDVADRNDNICYTNETAIVGVNDRILGNAKLNISGTWGMEPLSLSDLKDMPNSRTELEEGKYYISDFHGVFPLRYLKLGI